MLDKNRPYGQVLAEYTDGVLDASYVYGLDLIEQERDGDEYYYNVDGLGSTRGLTDENGEVMDSYVYDAFGNLIVSTGGTENDYLFAGEQFDKRLGQYYLRQRFYDSATGRFTRRDTYEGRLGEPITLHKYLYGNANPVNYIDPSGLFTLSFAAQSALLSLLAAASYTFIVTNAYEPERLGGFGDGPSYTPPNSTAHKPQRSLLSKLLGSRGFNDGPRPNPGPGHTGHPPDNTIYDLVSYLFGSSYNPAHPNRINPSILDIDDLTQAANESIGKGGLTKAGRALDKHASGQRGSSPFPPVTGNNQNKNLIAQQQVDEILNAPNAVFVRLGRGGIEVRVPDQRGIRFNEDGSFSGFVD